MSTEELAAIRTAAAAAELSLGRFVTERALDVQANPQVLLKELFAVRRLLREAAVVGTDELVERLDRVLEDLGQ